MKHEFTAGEKAILHKKIVVDLIERDGKYWLIESDSEQNWMNESDLSKCFTVRVLDNGMARTLNEFGDEPNYKDDPNLYRHNKKMEAWREAESKCRTLPFKCNGSQALTMHDKDVYVWYAYIENDHYVLVKPII